MRISGRHAIDCQREELFEKLLDPAFMAQCIPGCEKLEGRPGGGFDATIRVHYGLIRGAFTGKVDLRDVIHPSGYTMEFTGAGRLGSLRGTSRMALEPLEGSRTEVSFDTDVQLGGLLGRLGDHLIPGDASEFSSHFFMVLEKAIRNGRS